MQLGVTLNTHTYLARYCCRYTLSFYLPAQNQAQPPKPTSDLLYIDKTPATEYYVATFGGFADNTTVVKEAHDLVIALVGAGVKDFDATAHYYFAGSVRSLRIVVTMIYYYDGLPLLPLQV